MKKIFLLFVFVFLLSNCFSQNELPLSNQIHKNSLFIEFAGNGGNIYYIKALDFSSMLTLNYERQLLFKNQNYISSRIGFGFLPDKHAFLYSFPIEVNLNIHGIKSNYLEMGLGTTFIDITNKEKFLDLGDFNKLYYLRFGYRYIGNNNILLRIGFTPFFDFQRILASYLFTPFIGISFGYSFD